ncbi:MAG: hypothetical protein HYY25_00255 [Candidatus Wallbacteria bacterium]|nr:hypothetical protein [Candidatus Wallbacteria bacterium]
MYENDAWRAAMGVALGVALLVTGCGEGSSTGGATKPAQSSENEDAQPRARVFTTLEVGQGKAGEVTALCWDAGTLHIGTRAGLKAATYLSRPRKLLLREIASPSGRFEGQEVLSLTGQKGELLAGTNMGFGRFVPGLGWSSEETGRINGIASAKGVIYAGRTTGVERQDASNKGWDRLLIDPPLTRNQTSAQHVLSLAVGRDGELWAGTRFGLLHFLPATGKWEHFYGTYQDIKSEKVVTDELGNADLGGNYVNSVRFDEASGKLLVATDIGVSIFDGKWTVYTGEHTKYVVKDDNLARVAVKGNLALPSCEVRDALLEDASVLWIATKAGLARLAGPQLDVFDTERGLPDDTVNALAWDAASKTLFVGTAAGVAVVGYEGVASSE